jgi:hypothetical protein
MRASTGMIHVLALAAGTALLAGLCTPAQAGLGGNAASVEADSAQMKAQVAVTAGAGFTVQTLTLPTGTVVNEYLSPAGKVFAVSWRGQAIPDLQQTLGSFYSTASAALNNAPRAVDHRHRVVETADIVVHVTAHMRLHTGLVYVPALLPQGVSASDLR